MERRKSICSAISAGRNRRTVWEIRHRAISARRISQLSAGAGRAVHPGRHQREGLLRQVRGTVGEGG